MGEARPVLRLGGLGLAGLLCALVSCDRAKAPTSPPAAPRSNDAAPGPAAPSAGDGGSVIELDTAEVQRLVIEAESGGLEPRMTVRPHPKASGEKFIEAPEGPDHKKIEPDTGAARIRFQVKQDGEYVLWTRVGWCCTCGNSLELAVDQGEPFEITSGTDGYHWHWLAATKKVKKKWVPRVLKLSAGDHVLHVRSREDGSGLDQVLLTTDKEYVPTGIEKP